MPDLPPSLSQKAGQLAPLKDLTMSGTHIEGVESDQQYNKVAFQLNDIIDAWACVKNSISIKADPLSCFKDSVNN